MGDPQFRSDLFRGTAEYYDRFRVPYPQSLLDDLARRSGANGEGSLLDLACGPGLIAFPLHGRFREVWAVDQEPDMIDVARRKAAAAGIGTFRFEAAAAEDLSVPESSLDLVAIGNAFHRMQRDTVAARILRWLRPGGHLALLWGGSPWDGRTPWQRAMAETTRRWQARAQWQQQAQGQQQARGQQQQPDRIPPNYAENRERRPDLDVLRDAGFERAGEYRFPVSWEWTPDTLIGFAYSTSVVSRAALGDLASGFEEDLRREVLACEPSGVLPQTIEFAYELARRPA